MTFGEKLKSIRKHAGMSQEKLAEKIGVSRHEGVIIGLN
ncbi:MAG: helix-turn-helix domain-containing protein [Lachnospiraceae bacterium]|nr:helix-turn-helix domain-containing protein [Lachnospiraceae bacterium]